jgi:ribosomal protein S18 acetylase RimI-like enzyme
MNWYWYNYFTNCSVRHSVTTEIREMTLEDYDAALVLWQSTEGIGLSAADDREKIACFLAHNPGLSFVANEGGTLVGTVLCGSDGRRGYLYHLTVIGGKRKAGTGRLLVEKSLDALQKAGIEKCHIFVYKDNLEGIKFWTHTGWVKRPELVIMSYDI